MKKFDILAIVGSAAESSSNLKLVEHVATQTIDTFTFSIFNDLKALPHFDPDRSMHQPPKAIVAFRKKIEQANGVIICTPEYIFSIPSGLKNALEWCVATTVFSGKPLGIITASANGLKGHKELQLIMQTLMAVFSSDTTLLVQGIRGKTDPGGLVTHKPTAIRLAKFIKSYQHLVQTTYNKH